MQPFQIILLVLVALFLMSPSQGTQTVWKCHMGGKCVQATKDEYATQSGCERACCAQFDKQQGCEVFGKNNCSWDGSKCRPHQQHHDNTPGDFKVATKPRRR